MKKKILLTGGTGFVGSNILRLLSGKYDISAPRRSELNVIDQKSVDDYLKDKHFDAVIHCALLNPDRNPADRDEDLLDFTMRGLLNFKTHEDEFEKIIYIGSGAEFDKSRDIVDAKETDLGQVIPHEPYGYAKYVLTQIARRSKNIYNLRIFGCYGENEQDRRFIRCAVTDCLENRPINIRQNCMFSYVLVDDLVRVIDWCINAEPEYRDYNVCNTEKYSLLELAQIVKKLMKNDKEIVIQKEGFNKEYTADNSRLCAELKNFEFTPIEDGIKKEIYWLSNIKS